jgi:hypothetical protein
MSVYRGLYFATLAGAFGGLIAWALGLTAVVLLGAGSRPWLPDTITLVVFGLVIGVAVYLQLDRALLGKLRGSSVGYGLLFGGLGALAAAGAAFGFQRSLAPVSPILYRLAVWAICFSLIALGVGLRWANSNRARVLHTYVGGLGGGLLGGGLFVLLAPHLAAGVSLGGLVLAGAGTSFGAGIAPVLVRDGMMRFISSGDARAQNKLGKPGKLWDLAAEESYVVGSAITPQGGTVFQQGADIWLPDTSVAPRHAVVFSKEGRYFIARHPDASGPEGIARYILRIKGKTVVSSQELRPSDDLLIGRTALRFESRKAAE